MKIFGTFVGLFLLEREIQAFREPLAPSWRTAGAHSTMKKALDFSFIKLSVTGNRLWLRFCITEHNQKPSFLGLRPPLAENHLFKIII